MPGRGLAGSFVWHVILLSISIPISQMAEPAPKLTLPQIEITWYGPTTDVAPVVAPKPKEPKPSSRPRPKPSRPVVARAYNPRTTVVFQPPRATNRRQLLIEPDAPPTPPIFLPAIPNIIQWTAEAPPQPEIAVNPGELVARRPKRGSSAPDVRAPQIAIATPPAGPLDIAPDPDATPQPPLPIAPSAVHAERASAARPRAEEAPEIAAAPVASSPGLATEESDSPRLAPPETNTDIHAGRRQPAPKSAVAPTVLFAANREVAISLSPGNAAPPPPGNASAPVSIGPRIRKDISIATPNLSAAAGSEAPGAPAANAAAPGPAGLLILNESAKPAPPPAPRASSPLPKISVPTPITLRPTLPRPASRSAAGGSGIVPHDLAHEVLGSRPIRTLLMNMPNLTSATGSWVLNFAELPGEEIPLSGSVVAPLPVRKVDPEYPPGLIQEGVQGDVVLYAEIGSDGTVSHIRVVRSLDPVLDRNAAEAFAKWKFQPALVDNHPIRLEVLVHIPFHLGLSH